MCEINSTLICRIGDIFGGWRLTDTLITPLRRTVINDAHLWFLVDLLYFVLFNANFVSL